MSVPVHDRVLIVLTGPVGGGKSTTALAVAELLRARGVGAASIDLDQIYCMARQREGFGDEEIWNIARRGAAALSDVFFATVADAVIVEGGFHDATEIEGLADNVTTEVRVDVIALQVSFDRTLERVVADTDPGRVASRNPAMLKPLHDQFVAALPYLKANGTVLETDRESVHGVASQIVQLVPGQGHARDA
jgi:shikimate kinase